MFPVVHRKGDTCFQAIRYCPAPDHVSNGELWRSRKARDAGFLEIMKLFDHFKLFVPKQRHSAGVITAIFKVFESGQKERKCLLVADIANNSTHSRNKFKT